MPDTDRLVGAKGVRAVIARYNQAWADHDLDAIMALHTEDSVFENHTSGGLGIGREQIRKIIEGVFATFPDIAFSARRQYFGEDFAVQEWTATATFARPKKTTISAIRPLSRRGSIIPPGTLTASRRPYRDLPPGDKASGGPAS
ncbi:MAG: nuclear transport factor 2 family protein [Bauldia sp.]|nr:nuclear transport factor 2 family protein [Bauldia sp.]